MWSKDSRNGVGEMRWYAGQESPDRMETQLAKNGYFYSTCISDFRFLHSSFISYSGGNYTHMEFSGCWNVKELSWYQVFIRIHDCDLTFLILHIWRQGVTQMSGQTLYHIFQLKLTQSRTLGIHQYPTSPIPSTHPKLFKRIEVDQFKFRKRFFAGLIRQIVAYLPE